MFRTMRPTVSLRRDRCIGYPGMALRVMVARPVAGDFEQSFRACQILAIRTPHGRRHEPCDQTEEARGIPWLRNVIRVDPMTSPLP